MNPIEKLRRGTRRIFVWLILAGISLTSCKKEPFHAAYFSFIDDTKGTFAKESQVSPDGGTRTFTLISNRAWSIDYQQAPWISISPTSGKGVATITATIAPNESLDEDFIYLSITNNTLLVIKDFKITRQNYLGTYRGVSTITSPIAAICTTCTPPDITTVTSTSVLDFTDGKTKLNFEASVKIGEAASFPVNLTFEGDMPTVSENGKVKFVYRSTGTFDITPLGKILGDADIAGVKETIVDAELSGGRLTFQAVIDPGVGGAADPEKSTVIVFEGEK